PSSSQVPLLSGRRPGRSRSARRWSALRMARENLLPADKPFPARSPQGLEPRSRTVSCIPCRSPLQQRLRLLAPYLPTSKIGAEPALSIPREARALRRAVRTHSRGPRPSGRLHRSLLLNPVNELRQFALAAGVRSSCSRFAPLCREGHRNLLRFRLKFRTPRISAGDTVDSRRLQRTREFCGPACWRNGTP